MLVVLVVLVIVLVLVNQAAQVQVAAEAGERQAVAVQKTEALVVETQLI